MTSPIALNPHPLNDRFETLSISVLSDCPHVVVVGLNRPQKRNAMNAKMWREIGKAFGLLGKLGDGCRCVLLMGHGKAFSAGLDVSDTTLMMDNETTDVARKGLAFRPRIVEMQRCFSAVEQCPVPVVAAIHGPCIGAGVDLICCADVRLCCEEGTTFSVREVRLGLAADVGTLQRLPKIVGHGSFVRQVCLTGEDWNAHHAVQMGLVSDVSPNHQHLLLKAAVLCQRIASNSPVAVMGTKQSLNYSRDHSVEEGLGHIATHNALALMTDDLAASILASASKGDATFEAMLPHSKL